MKNNERVSLLYQKYLNDQLNAEELLEWMDIVQDHVYDAVVKDLLEDSFQQISPVAEAQDWQPAFKRFQKQVGLSDLPSVPLERSISWLDGLMPYWRTAAAVLLIGLLSYGYMRWQQHELGDGQELVLEPAMDVDPGSNQAVLRLADGQLIQLDEQGELIVKKGLLEDGLGNKLAAANQQTDTWRTIEIPKKGQYKLQLADGTQVWLNAASSLRFPVEFTGEDRTVYLEGEAFFVVSENKKHPFVVKSASHEVKVLGTSFNLSAYPNEVTATSLLTGLVEVRTPYKAMTLNPGMQSMATKDQLDRRQVDVDAISAWKDNRFVFTKESLSSIIRKLERWYDVEFIIQDGSEHLLRKTFSGSMTRFAKLSETLELFSITESLDCTIKGNKVYLK